MQWGGQGGRDEAQAAAERRARWTYEAAAEADKTKRKVLLTAWAEHGLTEEAIASRAEDGAEDAAEVDIFAYTPNCGNFSVMTYSKQAATEDVQKIARQMAGMRARRPHIVIVENVARLLRANRKKRVWGNQIEEQLMYMQGYEWYTQILNPRRHDGKPVARERAYWVGIRRHRRVRVRTQAIE